MHSGRLIRSLPPNPGSMTALYVLENDDFLITAGKRYCLGRVSFEFPQNLFSYRFFVAIHHQYPHQPVCSIRTNQAATKSPSTRSATKSHRRISSITRAANRCVSCLSRCVHLSMRPTYSPPPDSIYRATPSWRPSRAVAACSCGKSMCRSCSTRWIRRIRRA